MSIQCSRCINGCNDAEWHWLKTGPSQTGQLPGRIKSELCDLSGLRIDLISRLLSLSRLYSGILHSLSLSLSLAQSIPGIPNTRPVDLQSSPPFHPNTAVAQARIAPESLQCTRPFLQRAVLPAPVSFASVGNFGMNNTRTLQVPKGIYKRVDGGSR